MNIEIITIISDNYGNRLQNYALQEYLVSQGHHVVTSRTDAPHHPILRKVKKRLLGLRGKKTKDLFYRFEKKIYWKPDYFSHIKDDSNIDYYIAGSDQIWNPFFYFNSEREFLTFTNEKKRIAYAASIGISDIPDENKNKYKKYFDGIHNISVREYSAARIIHDLTGRDVPVVIDPTMLLSKNQWLEVTKESVCHISEPYVLKYFLGNNSEEVDNFIKEIVREKGCRLIDISPNKCKWAVGPIEFIDLISKAEFVCSDSFHGAVFSIIFEKNFITFDRPNEKGYGKMGERIKTLLKMFDLENRLFGSQYEVQANIDFSNIRKIIINERKKAMKYLSDTIQ